MFALANLKRWLIQNGAPWRHTERALVGRSLTAPAAQATPRTPPSFVRAVWPSTRPQTWPPANDWDDDETHFRDLLPTSCLAEIPVVDEAGEQIGRIETLSVDRATGQVLYALLRLRACNAEAAEVALPLPWSLLRRRPNGEGYVVKLRPEELSTAPRLSREDLDSFTAGDRAWRDAAAYFYLGKTII